MSSIPPDMYERVLELTVEITNATLAEDDALSQSLYQSLLIYHQEQAAMGRVHPFLTETVADYTDDPTEALRYYKLALEQSRDIGNGEPTQTILIGIASKLLELGQREQAEAHLRDGRIEATRRGDGFSVAEADRLMKEISG